MKKNELMIRGIRIILNEKLTPLQMKEKGYINGLGKKIVTELEVGSSVYYKLKEMEMYINGR